MTSFERKIEFSNEGKDKKKFTTFIIKAINILEKVIKFWRNKNFFMLSKLRFIKKWVSDQKTYLKSFQVTVHVLLF